MGGGGAVLGKLPSGPAEASRTRMRPEEKGLPGVPGVQGKRSQQVPNLGSPGPPAWHFLCSPIQAESEGLCWVKCAGCASGGW